MSHAKSGRRSSIAVAFGAASLLAAMGAYAARIAHDGTPRYVVEAHSFGENARSLANLVPGPGVSIAVVRIIAVGSQRWNTDDGAAPPEVRDPESAGGSSKLHYIYRPVTVEPIRALAGKPPSLFRVHWVGGSIGRVDYEPRKDIAWRPRKGSELLVFAQETGLSEDGLPVMRLNGVLQQGKGPNRWVSTALGIDTTEAVVSERASAVSGIADLVPVPAATGGS